jgi:hypothetical protein
MDDMDALLGCPTMNGFYQDMVHDLLCTTTMDGLALVFTGSFLIAFFLPLVMFYFKENTTSGAGEDDDDVDQQAVMPAPVPLVIVQAEPVA